MSKVRAVARENSDNQLVFSMRSDGEDGIDIVAVDPYGLKWDVLNIAPNTDTGKLELYRFHSVPEEFFEIGEDYRIADEA